MVHLYISRQPSLQVKLNAATEHESLFTCQVASQVKDRDTERQKEIKEGK